MTAETAESPTPEAHMFPGSFYIGALNEADLLAASQVEGIDGEIAFLRAYLLRLAKDQPAAVQAVQRGAELLIRAVVAKYRMSPADKEDLADAVMTVARKLTEDLMGEHDV